MAGKKKRGVLTYKSYDFSDDPILDIEKTVIQRSGMSFRQIHDAGGATPGTLKKHFNRGVKTTRFNTLMANIRAAGGDMEVILPKSGGRVRIPKK
jgi:hypothetical protein